MPPHSPAIGENLTALRKAAGLTQRQLAGRANVSLSMLSKVEVGDRAASHALTAAVSRALGVPVERLQGQPYGVQAPISLDPLRSSLRCLSARPQIATVRTLAELTAETELFSAWRQSGRYSKLASQLPPLIIDIAASIDTVTESAASERLYRILTDTLYIAHGLAFRLGHGDLAESIEQRLATAAERAEDPLAVGLARWTQANAFQAAGEYDRGLSFVEAAAAELRAEPVADSAASRVLHGSLHLRAATLASRAGDANATAEHLDQAHILARDFTQDEVQYHLTFGPTNTAIHEVAAAVELGDPRRAVEVGQRLTSTRGVPPTRVGHLHLDLARAQVALEDRPGALASLERARRAAPEQTRFHPMVAETTRVLISLHRRANPELTRFTTWLGLAS
jgi:transcriptional regulator with XRE-family HTH domain